MWLAVDGPLGNGRPMPWRDHADLVLAQNHRIEGPSEVQCYYEFDTVSVKYSLLAESRDGAWLKVLKTYWSVPEPECQLVLGTWNGIWRPSPDTFWIWTGVSESEAED